MLTVILLLQTGQLQMQLEDRVFLSNLFKLKFWMLTSLVCWARHRPLASVAYLVSNVVGEIAVERLHIHVCGVNYFSVRSLVLVQRAYRVVSEWEFKQEGIRKTTTGSVSARGLSTASFSLKHLTEFTTNKTKSALILPFWQVAAYTETSHLHRSTSI